MGIPPYFNVVPAEAEIQHSHSVIPAEAEIQHSHSVIPAEAEIQNPHPVILSKAKNPGEEWQCGFSGQARE
jgi:hypothetical protein